MKVSRKSIVIVSIAVLGVVVALIVWLVGSSQSPAPDFSDKNSEQIAGYLRSDEFNNLDRDARRAAARQAMRQMMAGRAKEYSDLPSEERIAYLDKVIDTMQSRRREFESMRGGFGGRRGGPESIRREFEGRREQAQFRSDAQSDQRPPRWRRGQRGRRRSPERMRARTEFVDPKTRAQMAKFREALRQRMRERGIDFRSPGR